MIDDKLFTIRSFFRRLGNVELGTLGRGGVLVIVSAALLSSLASGQVPTTTALPYLLKSPGAGIVVVATSGPVVNVPPAVTLSGFGSLLGGGFSSLLTAPIAWQASAAAIASVRELLEIKKGNFLKSNIAKMNQDAKMAEQNIEAEYPDVSGCDDFRGVKFNRQLKTALKSHNQFRTADSSVCSLPEEQQAQEAEEELQALNEAGNSSQDAIEAAEAAAEAAEAAAEAAETAAEAALDGIDVLEGLLDALALF
jgi:hypothetical protein